MMHGHMILKRSLKWNIYSLSYECLEFVPGHCLSDLSVKLENRHFLCFE